MTRQQRADYVRKRLGELYPAPPIPLDHKDPYTLLVAVLLSAQCTDVRVNKTTPALFALADNACEMAGQTVAAVDSIVRPCGLAPAKAKAIVGLSQIICEEYGGEVPRRIEQLEALPGVGHKTASVVMTQAFGVAAFPVDTHIHRLACHWGLSDGSSVQKTERDLKKLFPEESWNALHLQIIYYGREHYTARQKDPRECEVFRIVYPNRKNSPWHSIRKRGAK